MNQTQAKADMVKGVNWAINADYSSWMPLVRRTICAKLTLVHLLHSIKTFFYVLHEPCSYDEGLTTIWDNSEN